MRSARSEGLTRRQLLVRSASTAALAGLGSIAKPYLSRAADRPLIACGIQSGDVAADSAVIWARADRPARMQVECSTVESFASIILRTASADALPERDFTAKLLLDGLPPGQDIFYRVRFEDIDEAASPARAASGISAPRRPNAVDLVRLVRRYRGAGLGHRSRARRLSQLSHHAAKTVRTSSSIPAITSMRIARCRAELKLPNGEIWRNIVTEEKSVVAHSLAQFRGNYKYNWLDENFRAFHAEVPMFAQWDDHEVTNDWSPIGTARRDRLCRGRHLKLVARARRAFHEFMPIRQTPAQDGRVYRKIAYGPLLDVFLIDMRSYRDSTWNKRDDRSDAFILGATQLAWLKRELAASNATWKVIAADLPIGLSAGMRSRSATGRRSGASTRSPICCPS